MKIEFIPHNGTLIPSITEFQNINKKMMEFLRSEGFEVHGNNNGRLDIYPKVYTIAEMKNKLGVGYVDGMHLGYSNQDFITFILSKKYPVTLVNFNMKDIRSFGEVNEEQLDQLVTLSKKTEAAASATTGGKPAVLPNPPLIPDVNAKQITNYRELNFPANGNGIVISGMANPKTYNNGYTANVLVNILA